jgi:hypothetical protein
MIFPTHVMAPGTVTSFFQWPLVDTEFDMPGSEQLVGGGEHKVEFH